jgi:hypothetical protein
MTGVTDTGFDYKHLTADGQVKAGKGMLHTVTINKPATTAGVITLYDSLTEVAPVIAAITVGLKTEGQGISCLVFDLAFQTGLYVGFDGTIVGADITVTYY